MSNTIQKEAQRQAELSNNYPTYKLTIDEKHPDLLILAEELESVGLRIRYDYSYVYDEAGKYQGMTTTKFPELPAHTPIW